MNRDKFYFLGAVLRVNIVNIATTILIGLTTACRQMPGDEAHPTAAEFAGNRANVTGSLTSQTGSQSQMQGWAVALIEKDSGSGRVSDADVNGNLTFAKASLSAVQTVVLLSPDYLVQAVLSMPSNREKTIKQYFQMSKSTLPRLVQKGGVVNFQTVDGLAIQDLTSKDSDGDGIPDGISSLALTNSFTSSMNLGSADTDADGIDNAVDLDIDGDGLINAFDMDDDGDTIIDAIDSDANNDKIADTLQQSSDQHFKVGLEYIAVQNIVTSMSQSLKFVAKVREGVVVKAVKVRGATSFLTGSSYILPDGTSGAWDLALSDDGANDDAAAKDLLFVKNITLATGVSPRTNQVVFFQVVVGEGADQFTVEYPYIFPNLSAMVPTTSFDGATRIVTLAGDPFGDTLQDFVWSVSVNNSSGVKVYESNLTAGATRTQVIPLNVLVSGQSYTYKATAQLLDKVPGYPSMVVRSDEGTISP